MNAQGLDRWCYDALEPREWDLGDYAGVSLRRHADLVWIYFDHLAFCNVVSAIQPIEDFLANGPAARAPPAVAAAIVEYLLAIRVPGPSTVLAVEVALRGPESCHLIDVRLNLSAASPDVVSMPGSPHAGVEGVPKTDPRSERRRLLVPAPTGELNLQVTVARTTASESSLQTVKGSVPFAVTPHTTTEVLVEIDASRWPDLALASRGTHRA
ncbi:MAG: hypothetical protein JWM10_1833 [Myxococcaceae bacterium]|nr:hypothetical protein [Myxococcaceae bacterium]